MLGVAMTWVYCLPSLLQNRLATHEQNHGQCTTSVDLSMTEHMHYARILRTE